MLELDSYMGELLEKVGSPTIVAAGNFAMQLPAVFIGVIMALLSSYFFVDICLPPCCFVATW